VPALISFAGFPLFSLRRWKRENTAGIADGHPHRFRDSAAAELLKAGVDIRKVSTFLGHASVTTTEKYYAPGKKAQQDIMDDEIGAAQGMMEMHFLSLTRSSSPSPEIEL
jgi:integrase